MGGMASVLLSLGAVVALTAGMPGIAAVTPAPTLPLEVSVDEPMLRLRGKCDQCAVVTSIREIESLEHGIHSVAGSSMTKGVNDVMKAEVGRRYEVTVRMRDGSTRVFEQAHTANWRMNERLIFIEGSSAGNEPKAILAVAGDAG